MAARKNTPTNTAITFKIGEVAYRILTGQARDFLSCKPKDGGWSIMDDASTEAVVVALEKQVSRLKAS